MRTNGRATESSPGYRRVLRTTHPFTAGAAISRETRYHARMHDSRGMASVILGVTEHAIIRTRASLIVRRICDPLRMQQPDMCAFAWATSPQNQRLWWNVSSNTVRTELKADRVQKVPQRRPRTVLTQCRYQRLQGCQKQVHALSP